MASLSCNLCILHRAIIALAACTNSFATARLHTV
jgi:hypothetical protein